jgi:ATP-dependent Zn protease
MDEESAIAFALKATAYHEAGHAVMAMFLGRAIQKVTIIPGQSHLGAQRLGACHLQKGKSRGSHDYLEVEVMIHLAGMVAESQITGRYCQQGAAQDLRFVRRMLQSRNEGEKQIERLEKRLLSKTEHHLLDIDQWRAVEAIAAELIRSETISGRAAKHLYEQALREVNP